MWHIYLLECVDGSTYTGIATDVDARYRLHVLGSAAQYTRNHPPRALIAALPVGTRAQASHLERRIKHWSKARKLAFFQPYTTDWRSYCSCAPSEPLDSPAPELREPLNRHTEAVQRVATTQAEIWAILRRRVPSLTQSTLRCGLSEDDAARWACFWIDELDGSPADLIAHGHADKVLAYVLRVTHQL